jgi:hypothetical protein
LPELFADTPLPPTFFEQLDQVNLWVGGGGMSHCFLSAFFPASLLVSAFGVVSARSMVSKRVARGCSWMLSDRICGLLA